MRHHRGDPKSPEQLLREIAYYTALLPRLATSADRLRRCHVAIRTREHQLIEARRIQAQRPPSITCPHCHLTSYHPSDIRERYCGYCHRFHDDPPGVHA
jgi:hypothetical protein